MSPSPDDPMPSPGSQAEEHQVHPDLPAVPDAGTSAVAQPTQLVPRAFSHDLPRSLREADTAARYASNPHGDSDITVTAIAAVTCVGTTQADALRAVADWALEAQHMQIHSIALAQMEGPVEDSWECHVTLTVSSRDPETREFGGSTHHVPRSGR